MVGSFGCIKETIRLASNTTSLVTELEQQLICFPDLMVQTLYRIQKPGGLATTLSSERENTYEELEKTKEDGLFLY